MLIKQFVYDIISASDVTAGIFRTLQLESMDQQLLLRNIIKITNSVLLATAILFNADKNGQLQTDDLLDFVHKLNSNTSVVLM